MIEGGLLAMDESILGLKNYYRRVTEQKKIIIEYCGSVHRRMVELDYSMSLGPFSLLLVVEAFFPLRCAMTASSPVTL